MTAANSIHSRPGCRGRIGLIQPAPGVMIEYEWPRHLPEEVLFPMARLRMTGASADDWADLARRAPEAARDLASARCDVIGYACSVGSLHAGAAAEDSLVAALAAAAGRPAYALGQASIAAFAALGARTIAIATPYPPETNALIEAYLAQRGFVALPAAVYPETIMTIGDVPAASIAALSATILADRPDADALWIPCTAVRTLAAIPAIEQQAGRPVVSGSQALLWRGLRMIGIADPIADAGRLLTL